MPQLRRSSARVRRARCTGEAAQPGEIPPSEEKTKLVSERPSRRAARPGRLRRVMRVIALVFTGLLAAVLIFVTLTLLGVVPPLMYPPVDRQEPIGSTALLEGASFGTPTSRTPETQPVFITYQDKSGQSFTANAFPGEVWVVVAQETSPEKVESLITSTGGTLYGAIPSVGFYWASVPAGGEADFIAAMNHITLVLKATPNEVASLSQGGGLPPDVTDFEDWVNKFAWEPEIPLPIDNVNLLVFDGFRRPLDTSGACSTVTHGDAVAGIAGKDGVPVKKFNITTVTGAVEPSLPAWAIISAGMAAEQQDRKLVLNFSFGNGPRDFVDRHACTKGSTLKECNYYKDEKGKWKKWNYESMEQSQRNFLEEIAMVLDAMRTIVPSQFDRIAVVLCAHNGGMELTDEIAYIKRNYPEAFKHMFIAGGTDSEGARWENVNSSNNQDDMLYGLAENVEAPPGSGCRVSGTSFSAPEASNTLARLAADKSLRRPHHGTVDRLYVRCSAADGHLPQRAYICANPRQGSGPCQGKANT